MSFKFSILIIVTTNYVIIYPPFQNLPGSNALLYYDFMCRDGDASPPFCWGFAKRTALQLLCSVVLREKQRCDWGLVPMHSSIHGLIAGTATSAH